MKRRVDELKLIDRFVFCGTPTQDRSICAILPVGELALVVEDSRQDTIYTITGSHEQKYDLFDEAIIYIGL